jgi:hypothetical protein
VNIGMIKFRKINQRKDGRDELGIAKEEAI